MKLSFVIMAVPHATDTCGGDMLLTLVLVDAGRAGGRITPARGMGPRSIGKGSLLNGDNGMPGDGIRGDGARGSVGMQRTWIGEI